MNFPNPAAESEGLSGRSTQNTEQTSAQASSYRQTMSFANCADEIMQSESNDSQFYGSPDFCKQQHPSFGFIEATELAIMKKHSTISGSESQHAFERQESKSSGAAAFGIRVQSLEEDSLQSDDSFADEMEDLPDMTLKRQPTTINTDLKRLSSDLVRRPTSLCPINGDIHPCKTKHVPTFINFDRVTEGDDVSMKEEQKQEVSQTSESCGIAPNTFISFGQCAEAPFVAPKLDLGLNI